MKKLITSIIFMIIIIMSTTIYAAGESKLSIYKKEFRYSNDDLGSLLGSTLGLPPVVFTANQDLLLCARAHTTLKYGNTYTRTAQGIQPINCNRTSYIVSETRRTGAYILDGKKIEPETTAQKYTAGAQQVAFWKNDFEPKGDLKNGNDTSGISTRLGGYVTEGNSLLSEAKAMDTYFTNDVIDGILQVKMGQETTPLVYPATEKGEFKIGPISINYPRNRTVGNMNLAEISDIIIVDAYGNPVEGEFTIEGMTKKLSNRGTYYYDVEDDEEKKNDKAKFYIYYKPKDGADEDDEIDVPASIQIQIKFLYLKGFANAEYAGYENSLKSGQPLMNIYAIDEWAYQTFTVGTDINQKFDLSLKKSIIQVGDIAINDRVTVESTIGLGERLSYNAAYNKSTDIPLLNLKNLNDTNNKIIYRIRIYNEGDIAGKATKIEDHLPDGLEFVGITKNPGYDVEYENNKITLTATGDLKDIDAFDGNKMDYEDIEIECKFTDDYIDENIDEHKLTLTIDSDNDDLEKNEEVRYTITVTNEGTEEEKINTIMQTLPKKLEFIEVEKLKVGNDVIVLSEFDEEDWVEVIENSDKSKYIYYNLEDIEIGKLESGEKIEIVALCKTTSNIDEDEKLETSCKIVSTEAYEKDKSLYTTINKTVWYNNEEGIVTKENIDKVEYTLTQTIEKIKDKNGASQSITSDHTAYNVKKGHVIEYKIKVTGENTDNEDYSPVTVVTYLPDGLEIIPLDNEKREELEAETENSNLNRYNNNGWTILNDNTVTKEVNVGGDATLYCVLKEGKGTFTTISEVVSEYEDTATSTYDKSDLSKYIFEKQESDDDYSIISTYSETEADLDYIDLKVEGIEIEENEYIITIKNEGKGKATLNKIYSNISGGVLDTEDDNIDGFKVESQSGKEIILTYENGLELNSGDTKTIRIPYERTNEEIVLDGDVEKNIVTVSAQIVEADGNEVTKSDWYEEETKVYDVSGSTGETHGYTSEEVLNEALKNTAKITEVEDINGRKVDEDGKTIDRDSTDWIDTEKIMVTYDKDDESGDLIKPGSTSGSTSGSAPTPTPTPTPSTNPSPSPDPIIKLTTTISGYVFEDNGSNKENEPNNVYDTDLDTLLEGIKVTLIEKDTGNIATLFQETEEKPEITVEQAKARTNPTITDEKGYYSFEGVNPLKEYYINFEYNGVLYETVEANVGEDYKVNSKALETSGDRQNLNNNFADINVNSNTYSKEELVGKSAILYTYNGRNNLNIYELIAEYTKKYIEDNKSDIIGNLKGKFDYNSMFNQMKEEAGIIAPEDTKLKDKLEFIENTQIEATTKNTDTSYPLNNQYVIDTETGTIEQTQESNKIEFEESTEAKEKMKDMYNVVSDIMQEYVNADSQLVGNVYKNLVIDSSGTNRFFQQSREGIKLSEEYDDYIVPLLDSSTSVDEGSYYPTTTYKGWDKDNNTSTNNGYLYELRNELAYLLNSNRLIDLENQLNNSSFSDLKKWSYTEAVNESNNSRYADKYKDGESAIYGWSLEKLEDLWYVRVEKRTKTGHRHYYCSSLNCKGHCNPGSWTGWSTTSYYVSKDQVNKTVSTSSCSKRNST